MKKVLIIIYLVFSVNICILAQDNNLILVKAGTRIMDYFPLEERYRYPDFTEGKLLYKNGNSGSGRFNYNILLGEMEFLQSQDTFSIINKKDINLLVVASDTFFYNNGYIEQISGGPVKLGLMQNIRLVDIQRKGAFGVTDRNSSIDTYNSMSLTGNFYDLIPNEDWLFEKTSEYFISVPAGGFVQISRKNILEIFPEKKEAIKTYLKSNKINFDSREDLFKLVGFLTKL